MIAFWVLVAVMVAMWVATGVADGVGWYRSKRKVPDSFSSREPDTEAEERKREGAYTRGDRVGQRRYE